MVRAPRHSISAPIGEGNPARPGAENVGQNGEVFRDIGFHFVGQHRPKRALATFGNPFGLALYDREQKNVRRTKPPAAKPALWVVKDSAGAVTGKLVDRVTCASSGVTAFEEAETVEVLEGLWGHNEPLIAKLQNLLTQNPGENTSASSAGNCSGNGGTPFSDPGIDLLATYQQCYTKLRDKLSIDGEATNIERGIDDAALPKPEGRVDVETKQPRRSSEINCIYVGTTTT